MPGAATNAPTFSPGPDIYEAVRGQHLSQHPNPRGLNSASAARL